MADAFQVTIAWKTTADGGRQSPVRGPVYGPTVELKGLHSECDTWSVRLIFPATAAGFDLNNAILTFVAHEAPTHAIRPGMDLVLQEGRTVTATAHVIGRVSVNGGGAILTNNPTVADVGETLTVDR